MNSGDADRFDARMRAAAAQRMRDARDAEIEWRQSLDRRLAAIEAYMAMRDVGITPTTPLNSYGCVCPVGAEKTCKGYGCPRISHNMGPGVKAIVF